MGGDNNEWIGLAYKMSSLPSRCRVQIWRRLKSIGAVYYQQGMAVLPKTERLLESLISLRSEILCFGGEASVISISFLDAEDEKAMVAQFNKSVRSDINEIVKFFNRLNMEIEKVRLSKNESLPVLQELLSSLKKANRTLEQILKRDYFNIIGDEQIKMQKSLLAQINTCISEARAEN